MLLSATACPFKSESLAQNDPPSNTSGTGQGQQTESQSQAGSSSQGQQQQSNQQSQTQAGSSTQDQQQSQQGQNQQQLQLQQDMENMGKPPQKGPDPKIKSNKQKYRDYHETIFIDGQHMKKPDHNYKVRFYDKDNVKVGACVVRTDNKGRFENAFYIIKGTEKPGTWHAEAGPAGENITEDTCYFEVLPSAIPEFPTIVAGIAVPGMCAFIYSYLRK